MRPPLGSCVERILAADVSTGAKLFAVIVVRELLAQEKPWVELEAPWLEQALSCERKSRLRWYREAEKAGLIMRRGGGIGSTQYTLAPELYHAAVPSGDSRLESHSGTPADALQSHSGTPADALQSHSGTPEAPVVVEEVVDIPPYSPPTQKFAVDQRVRLEIAGDLFDGFRSALEEYLGERVPVDRQWAYLMTVQSWIQMAKAPFQELMKEDRWRTMVAAAVNKLLAMAPEEEPKMYASAKGQIGSPDALRQAIRYELTQAKREDRYGGNSGKGSGTGGVARLGKHTPTDPSIYFE